MKQISTIIFCLLLLITGCKSGGGGGNAPESIPAATDKSIPGSGEEDFTAPAYADIFKMWEAFDGSFADADKTDQDDSNMCWAASAANILAWAGWAADEDDTFDILRSHFDNTPGYVYDALQFYFNQYVAGVSAEMVSVRETRSYLLLDFIVSGLHEGKGVVIKIAYPDQEIGHFLTVFGYQYFPQEDNFALYFTDSDDLLHQMRYVELEWNDAADRWETQGPYADWYLEYVVSLAGN